MFIKFEKLILKHIWKCKRSRTAKTTLKKKNIGDIFFLTLRFKMIAQYYPKNKGTDKWNRIDF